MNRQLAVNFNGVQAGGNRVNFRRSRQCVGRQGWNRRDQQKAEEPRAGDFFIETFFCPPKPGGDSAR